MSCSHDITPGRELFAGLSARAAAARVPITGAVELTARCNLRCRHCYQGHSTRAASPELTTAQWLDLIDQMAGAGCLILVFTGGEVLLRPDFCDIYRHACQSGLLAVVFTNGTLVTGQARTTFAQYPPHVLEISLYGATAATYESITGVAGSFKKCIRGICRLKSHGVRLRLKTMLMTMNCDELRAMEEIASNLDVPFRFDPLISPRLDGDREPVRYRVDPRAAVEHEIASPCRLREQHDFVYRVSSGNCTADLYQCNAGLTTYHVNAAGMMRPCLMVAEPACDLTRCSFNAAWHSPDFRSFRHRAKAPEKCRGCDAKAVCGYCPGFFQLESGRETVCSEYICAIGSLRKQAIVDFHGREPAA